MADKIVAPARKEVLRHFRTGISCGALIVALGCAVLDAETANAQNAAPASASAPQGVSTTNVATAPSDSYLPADIIVTARRREEHIQDVPIAITAFNENALAQKAITDGFDLQRAAPSLIASTSGNRTDGLTYSMRGQSNTYGTGGASVIVYFADVPQSAGYAGAPFFDLANVQVLAGPQGTLFGQSSTGGAVLFAPRRPTQQFEGYIDGSFGNLSYRKLEGAINIPLTDTLAVRLAGNLLRRDGFTHDVTYNINEDDEHEENWRVGVEWKPSDWFSDYLVVDGRDVDVNGTAYSLYQVFGPGLILPDGSFNQALADQQARGPRAIANTPGLPHPSDKVENWGFSNTAAFNIGTITIKDILGYRKTIGEPTNALDGDGTPLSILEQYPAGYFPPVPAGFGNSPGNSYTLSNELQVLGKAFGNRLDWIVGGFYSHYNSGLSQQNFSVISPVYNYVCTGPDGTAPCVLGSPPSAESPTVGTTYGYPNTRTSKAVFAQGTFKVTDALSLTAGYRYSGDKSTTGSGYFAVATPVGPFLVPTAAGSYSSTGSSYNLSIDYKLSNKVLIYFANRRGYKAGQAVGSLYPGDVGHYTLSPIKPETIIDFELGAKTEWRSGDLSGHFNAAGYYSDYKNIQRQVASAYTSAPIPFNVAKAHILGLELVGSIAYGGFSLDGSYAYTDAKYNKFVNPFTGPGQLPDEKNDPFGFVPKHKVNVSAHYELALGDNMGRIGSTVGYSWQAKFYYTDQSFNFPNAIVPSHGLVNARIDWTNPFGTKMTLSLFGDNLTNKTYIENGNLDAGEVGRVFYGAPRTYGVEIRYHF